MAGSDQGIDEHDERTDGAGGGLRAAVIGYGSAGRGIHARLLAECGYRVTRVLTRDPGRVHAARADWPGVTVHADLTDLLGAARDEGDVDVVVLASPSGRHEEQALEVIAHGLPLLCDKPLATTAAGALRVVRAAEDAAVPLTVFHNRRWDTEQLTLRALLERGDLGTLHRLERRWERWRPVPLTRWKEQAVGDGGGLLLDLGTHLVDSAVQVLGPAVAVYAEIQALTTPAEDHVFLSVHHEGGAVSHGLAGSLVGAPGPRTRALGTGGAYLVTEFEGEPTPFARMSAKQRPDEHGWFVRGDEVRPVPVGPGGHADVYRALARWLAQDGPVPVDPWDAVHVAAVLDAARESARNGVRVEVVQPR